MNFEGRLLGNRYELIQKIGVGGMATVYKANDHVLNRYVAVKILRDEFTTDNEFVRRFNTEAQAAARLTHPNIVSIYDVGNEGNVYYIVMELIQGKTLKEIIDEEGTISWKWATNIAIQIAMALEMAHRNNIIHRDIKPHNIIITEDGVAKVTDFGIAKAVSNSTITAFGTTIGSVHYFSPEHARGGFTDAKSDIYSLGVVMYEMLTGRVPFDADTPVSVALKHLQEVPVEPIKINPLIPESLNRIILKAMQKDPMERYQTATDMLRDLKEVTKNPNGEYVVLDSRPKDAATQRIDISDTKVVKEANQKSTSRPQQKPKKENKVIAFFKAHKAVRILSIILACILVFFITMGITIGVIDSGKPKQIQIPNLIGKTLEEVKKITEENGLKYEVTEEFSSSADDKDKVISQEPKYTANYKVLENSTVKVVISKGLEMTKIPKVVGLTKAEAEKAIREAGLKAEFGEEISETVPVNVIIKQDPEENKEVPKGTLVGMAVSKGNGKEEKIVPNLVGKTEEAAKAELEANKLVASVKYEENMQKSNGVVLKQDKEAESRVDEGTTITITVNKLPEIKTGTVNVNIKELTGYKEPEKKETTNNTTNSTEEEETTTSPKDVKLTVMVDGSTYYEEDHSEDTENVSVSIEGIGNVRIQVKIDGDVKADKYLDLNSSDPTLNVP